MFKIENLKYIKNTNNQMSSYNYHTVCQSMSLFGTQVVLNILLLLNIIVTAVRDFLNILWAIKEMFRYEYNQKIIIVSCLLTYVVNKYIEVNYTRFMHKIPVGFVGFYLIMRVLKYYEEYVLLNKDPFHDGSPEDMVRLNRALGYLSIKSNHSIGFESGNLEFYEDWKKTQEELKLKKAQEQYDCSDDENDENEESGEKSDSDDSSDLECCDECGEKDIDPNDLGEGDLNLADIGGGYAHEYCVSDKMMKEYRKAIGGEVSEDDETDEELEEITNSDFTKNEESMDNDDDEPIKRGWFNWNKEEQHRKTT
tara:strand:+ start:2900 stop:3829 length:930 start_codon:yes stop_codon:yes gene_type:complete